MNGTIVRVAGTLLGGVLLLGLAIPGRAATVEYIHTDALGSPVAVTDSNGVVIERREYEPYGRQLSPTPVADGPGYTGHVSDAATGLDYMQQRYYDPLLGVFLSVDPVNAYENPIDHFHRYRYANSNPYLFVDPDGQKGVAWLVKLGTKGMRKLARLTKEQAVRARTAGQNVVADRRQLASQIETAAHGRDGQLKHAAHELAEGEKGLPHYQTEGIKGHSFWGKLSVGIVALADALDQGAEAADLIDPYRISDAGPENECANSCGIPDDKFRGKKLETSSSSENAASDLDGFQGVFRVEGRLDSKRLSDRLDK